VSSKLELCIIIFVKREEAPDMPCTIAKATAVFGDTWNVLLIRQACMGSKRFDEFQDELGIGRNILNGRLAALVDEGVFSKVSYQTNPERYEYRLTQKGRDAWRILAAMAAWADTHSLHGAPTPLVYKHKSCNHRMHAEVVCSHCGDELDVREVLALPGPGHPEYKKK